MSLLLKRKLNHILVELVYFTRWGAFTVLFVWFSSLLFEIVLVSAVVEVIFFTVAGTVLCFGFLLNTVLII